jgi:CxC2 like cysteine cluster associated with KDZ transposases
MDYDDIDDIPATLSFGGTIPASGHFGSTKPGEHEKDRHPLMTIVDRSGIHEIGVSWCCCPEAPEHEMQLMMAGLFPATFRNPKTAFTFRVLEEFHLDNLECKTTPGQFFSRLRRLTNDQFPNLVPVSGCKTSVNCRLTSRHRIDIGSF